MQRARYALRTRAHDNAREPLRLPGAAARFFAASAHHVAEAALCSRSHQPLCVARRAPRLHKRRLIHAAELLHRGQAKAVHQCAGASCADKERHKRAQVFHRLPRRKRVAVATKQRHIVQEARRLVAGHGHRVQLALGDVLHVLQLAVAARHQRVVVRLQPQSRQPAVQGRVAPHARGAVVRRGRKRAVVCVRQHVHRRLVARKRGNAACGGRVPDLQRAVIRRRRDAGAVWAEHSVVHRVLVAQRAQARAAGRVPHLQ